MLDLEPVPLRPAHVHPHEHLGPVLGLGAAGAGMDREEGVAAVLGPLQHGLELERLHPAGDLLGLPHQLASMAGSGSASSSCAISTAPSSRWVRSGRG